jgi:membrane protein DedA with SNARE-associated domain
MGRIWRGRQNPGRFSPRFDVFGTPHADFGDNSALNPSGRPINLRLAPVPSDFAGNPGHAGRPPTFQAPHPRIIMHELINWLVNTIGAMGYPGIFLLMAMESSVIPIPSEVVMPPAGYLVHEGKMEMWLVILSGTLGSLVGAYANYFVARWLGRPLVIKYGRYVWITEEHFNKVESYFLQHGEISTFIGRLLPVIRHLISIPAGIARMNHWRFSLYTTVGAAIWVSILSWIGYFIGQKQELIAEYAHEAVIGVVIFSVILGSVYTMLHRRKLRRQQDLA